ncbi:hypothetical protein D9758_008169 [Tetrapyrgos nigripes]|uniref:Uncharacterized protein n=1 Tax=Tetrapyrgos nigripes TaxID=182062 RepID=A0A8H5LPR3_9AGAR|nr:hypothetical protein D9758_008169 [Tetrapyrgos nigripes]
MSSRRLDLHASALNDAEYQLYTTSLADITLADEGNEPQNGSNSNWNGKKQETNQCHDDAYYDRLTLSVREARAWFRGRYSHVAAGTIDTILRFFSPNLSATDTLTGGQFFAAIRLIVHAESGKEVDRTLAFVQAHPPQTPTSGPGVVSSTSTSTSTSATSPLPPKRVVPPMPVSRKSFDAAHNNPFAAAASASSQPTETQASQTQTPLQTQPPAPPPQHPSSVSSHNPFSFTTRSKSTPGPPKPFTPSQSQSHDGSSTLVAESITPSNSKLPPLPPRKPPPPVPNASANVSNASSSSTLPTPAPTPMPIPVHAPVPLNPPPPPRHNSLLSNATSFLTSSKSPPTHLPGSPFGSPFSSDQGHNYGTVIPPLFHLNTKQPRAT